jgi:hypothetical protein
MSDTPMIVGFGGTVATVSLGQWSDIIAIVCGIATTAYMITKLIQTLRKKD